MWIGCATFAFKTVTTSTTSTTYKKWVVYVAWIGKESVPSSLAVGLFSYATHASIANLHSIVR